MSLTSHNAKYLLVLTFCIKQYHHFIPLQSTANFWNQWKEFEIKHGNEDTVREMLRIKRSVQATYNTQVGYRLTLSGSSWLLTHTALTVCQFWMSLIKVLFKELNNLPRWGKVVSVNAYLGGWFQVNFMSAQMLAAQSAAAQAKGNVSVYLPS